MQHAHADTRRCIRSVQITNSKHGNRCSSHTHRLSLTLYSNYLDLENAGTSAKPFLHTECRNGGCCSMASAVTVKRQTTVTLVGSSASGLFYNK